MMEETRQRNDQLQLRGKVIGYDEAIVELKQFEGEEVFDDPTHHVLQRLASRMTRKRDEVDSKLTIATQRLEATIERNRNAAA